MNNILGAQLMKFLTYIFAFAYFLSIEQTFAEQKSESGIAVIVNDKSILSSDLNHRVNLLIKGTDVKVTPDMMKEVRRKVMEQMIDEALQLQIMKKFDITVEGPELDSAWGMMAERLGVPQGQLDAYLKENHIPIHVVKDQIKSALGWQKYISERYGKDVQVSDTEVKKELARIEKNKQKNQALLSEIVLSYDNPEQAQEAEKKAKEASAKLRSGAAFPLIAQQYSHSASAARGGDIGWVSMDELDPAVKKVVETINRGEVSNPIPVKGGYRIVGVRDRHGVGSLGESVEYVSFQQIEFKFPMFGGEEGVEEMQLTASTIREKARTCSMMKKMTDGRPRIKNQFVEHVQTEQMHPELAKVLKKLKPGERSQLMQTGDGLIMFMMCDKDVVKPHEPDEKEIRNILREKKINTINDKELRSLRRTAFIDKKINV